MIIDQVHYHIVIIILQNCVHNVISRISNIYYLQSHQIIPPGLELDVLRSNLLDTNGINYNVPTTRCQLLV